MSEICKKKTCTKCGLEKSINEFSKHKYSKDGHRSYCKKCGCQSTKEYVQRNTEKVKEARRIYYKNNKEKIVKKSLEWASNNKKHREKYLHNYHLSHKQTINERSKKWRKSNSEKFKESLHRWYEENKEHCLKYAKENKKRIYKQAMRRYHEKYKHRPDFKINILMSTSIRQSIKNNKAGRHWESLVGYTLKELMQHIEKQFRQGMTWDNHGEWHIDHKIPKSWFDFNSPEDAEFKQCWSLCNLQPLWAEDNLKKGNRTA